MLNFRKLDRASESTHIGQLFSEIPMLCRYCAGPFSPNLFALIAPAIHPTRNVTLYLTLSLALRIRSDISTVLALRLWLIRGGRAETTMTRSVIGFLCLTTLTSNGSILTGPSLIALIPHGVAGEAWRVDCRRGCLLTRSRSAEGQPPIEDFP